jgi:hypothetical protein
MLEHCQQNLTKVNLVYFQWNLKRINGHVVFFIHVIPLGHGVKQNLNAGILLPTVIE